MFHHQPLPTPNLTSTLLPPVNLEARCLIWVSTTPRTQRA